MSGIETGYRPGVLGAMVGLHMAYYARHWGFGAGFEAKLAAESGAFLDRYDARRDLIASAWDGEACLGTIFVDGSGIDGPGAHLRWFIVGDRARGTGLGRALMARALEFVDDGPDRLAWLTTFRGLEAAAHLYAANGFVLTAERDEDQWQGGVIEQRWERGKSGDL